MKYAQQQGALSLPSYDAPNIAPVVRQSDDVLGNHNGCDDTTVSSNDVHCDTNLRHQRMLNVLRSDATALCARRAARLVRPRTADQLHGWVRTVLGFDVPRRSMIDGHDPPFTYLEHSFFEHIEPRDCIVWANRGGGKTQLGAIATLLDLLFKPGIQVRILGGSFEQSSKMYAYLRAMLDSSVFTDLVDGRSTGRALALENGSRVEVLTQSQRAVRGLRVHKLRCDEVELFDPEVWEAAQLVTRGGKCGDIHVHGCVEALSTMHKPYGLMQSIVDEASGGARRVIRWGALDVMERCPASRSCAMCSIVSDCQGRAREGRGHLLVDDALRQHQRVSVDTWESEMLCKRPSRSDSVYQHFDIDRHVESFDVPVDACVSGEFAAGAMDATNVGCSHGVRWVGGMDFGYRAPTVMLWAFVDDNDVLHVVDELVCREATVEETILRASERPWPRPVWVGADPAGLQRNDQTGQSAIACWRRRDWRVRTCRSSIEHGINLVRARLRPATGEPRLKIHPRCDVLVRSLVQYHYPASRPDEEQPVKDGNDHGPDALRYLIVNLDRRPTAMRRRRY